MGTVLQSISENVYMPIVCKERYDLLIQVLEGFHQLGKKGYPGALAFTHKSLNLLGEKFPLPKQSDSEKRIKNGVNSIVESVCKGMDSNRQRAFKEKMIAIEDRINVALQRIDLFSDIDATKAEVIKEIARIVEETVPDNKEILLRKFISLVNIEGEIQKNGARKLAEQHELFLKSLQDKEFYNKKLQQFTKRMTINLDESGLSESAKTRELAEKLRSTQKVGKLKLAALSMESQLLDKAEKIFKSSSPKLDAEHQVNGLIEHEKNNLILRLNEGFEKERKLRQGVIKVLNELLKINSNQELNRYLNANPDAIAVVKRLNLKLAKEEEGNELPLLKEKAKAELKHLQTKAPIPSNIANFSGFNNPGYATYREMQPFVESIRAIESLESYLKGTDKKAVLSSLKTAKEKNINDTSVTNDALTRETQEIDRLVTENYFDNARSRYDAIMAKFNDNFSKAFKDEKSIANLDANGIAFFSAVKRAVYTLNGVECLRNTLNILVPVLWVKDKPTPGKEGLVEKYIRSKISDPMVVEKQFLSSITSAIEVSSPKASDVTVDLLDVAGLNPSKKAANKAAETPSMMDRIQGVGSNLVWLGSSLLWGAGKMQSGLQQLQKIINNPEAGMDSIMNALGMVSSNVEDDANILSLQSGLQRSLFSNVRNTITDVSFEMYEKFFINLKKLEKNEFIKSPEWKNQIDKMQPLREQIAALNERQKALLKAKSEGRKVDEEIQQFILDKDRLGQATMTMLRATLELPLEPDNLPLLSLIGTLRHVSTGIDDLDWYLEIGIKANHEYLANKQQYADPFDAVKDTIIRDRTAAKRFQTQTGVADPDNWDTSLIRRGFQTAIDSGVNQLTRSQLHEKMFILDQLSSRLDETINNKKKADAAATATAAMPATTTGAAIAMASSIASQTAKKSVHSSQSNVKVKENTPTEATIMAMALQTKEIESTLLKAELFGLKAESIKELEEKLGFELNKRTESLQKAEKDIELNDAAVSSLDVGVKIKADIKNKELELSETEFKIKKLGSDLVRVHAQITEKEAKLPYRLSDAAWSLLGYKDSPEVAKLRKEVADLKKEEEKLVKLTKGSEGIDALKIKESGLKKAITTSKDKLLNIEKRKKELLGNRDKKASQLLEVEKMMETLGMLELYSASLSLSPKEDKKSIEQLLNRLENMHKVYQEFNHNFITSLKESRIKEQLEPMVLGLYLFPSTHIMELITEKAKQKAAEGRNSTLQGLDKLDDLKKQLNDLKEIEFLIKKYEVFNSPKIQENLRGREGAYTICYAQINKLANDAIKKVSVANMLSNSPDQNAQNIEQLNSIMKSLESLDKAVQSKVISATIKQIKEGLEKTASYKNFSQHVLSSMEKYIGHGTKTKKSVEALYKEVQRNNSSLIMSTTAQLAAREKDILFLQKVLDLTLNKSSPEQNTRNATALLGAIEYLDKELQSTAFTVGVNNFKKVLHTLKTQALAGLKKEDPKAYQALENLSKNPAENKAFQDNQLSALKALVKNHPKDFKEIPIAKKLLIRETVLHQPVQKPAVEASHPSTLSTLELTKEISKLQHPNPKNPNQ